MADIKCRLCGGEIKPVDPDRHCGRIALCNKCYLEVDAKDGLPLLLCGHCPRCEALKNLGVFNDAQRARNDARKRAGA